MMTDRIRVEKPTSQKIAKLSYKTFVVIFITVVLLLTYIPILVIGINSISTDPMGYRFTGLTFDWYGKLFEGGELTQSIVFTLEITILSTIISTIFGTASAIGINALNKNARKKFIILNNVPILNADIVTAAFLLIVFQILSLIIGTNIISQYGFITTLIAHVLFSTPYVVLSVLPKLNKDNSLYDAAIDLGCTPTSAIFKVILPNVKAGIFSGALLAFTMSIDDFIITYFVSGSNDNFSTWLYGSLKQIKSGAWPQACAYNTLLMAVTFIAIVAYQLLSKKKVKK